MSPLPGLLFSSVMFPPHPLLCRPIYWYLLVVCIILGVGQDILTSTAVDVHTSANMEHAAAVMQTGVRHNMKFSEVAMHGLGKSTDDYRYSNRLPCEVCA